MIVSQHKEYHVGLVEATPVVGSRIPRVMRLLAGAGKPYAALADSHPRAEPAAGR